MKHKTKLIATLMAMCLVITLGAFGILAVKTLNMSVGGNITFSADGLDFSISDGTFETTAGAEYPGVNSDNTKLKGFAMNTNTKESDVATQKASWSGLNLTMSSLGDVVLVFTVTNNMTENLVTTIEVTTLGTNTNNNMEINVVGGTVTKGTPKEMSITFHIKDTNINAGLTGFAVAVNFAKEGYIEPGSTQSNPVDGATLPTLTFTPISETEVSIKDNGYVGELIIPAYVEIDGTTYMVSQIEEYGFYSNKNITSVYIPASVQISNYSFKECTNLVKVDLQEGVKSIGDSAFSGNKALTTIRLPASLESIGNYGFSCENLKTVYMDCNPGFIVEQSCIYNNTEFVYINKNITPTSYFTKVGEEGNYYKYTETLHYYGGGDSNDWNCGFTSVKIPNSVITIEDYAFVSSQLKRVVIGDNVPTISNKAFNYCPSLISFTINRATSPILGNNAFYKTNNCKIYVPAGSVEAYKTAEGWTPYADRIQAIPA